MSASINDDKSTKINLKTSTWIYATLCGCQFSSQGIVEKPDL